MWAAAALGEVIVVWVDGAVWLFQVDLVNFRVDLPEENFSEQFIDPDEETPSGNFILQKDKNCCLITCSNITMPQSSPKCASFSPIFLFFYGECAIHPLPPAPLCGVLQSCVWMIKRVGCNFACQLLFFIVKFVCFLGSYYALYITYLSQDFLSTLNPSVTVDDSKIIRWHPKFHLDNIPDIDQTPLPEPPVIKTFTTAHDVLSKACDSMAPRVGIINL